MSKGKEAGKIQVYVRVRPFTEREKEKRETNAIEIHQEHSLIRVLDPRSRTNYFFDGVFSPEASNQEVYLKVGKPLVYAALNGYKGTLLTYGQTGTGKTFTLLSDDGVTTRVVQHCFEKIDNDEIHTYKVMRSFLQVYQEKVYDLLNPRFIVDLPVREHPKKVAYVGTEVLFRCRATGLISWRKGSIPVSSLDLDRMQILPNGDLRVENITEDDNDVYTCIVTNFVGPMETKEARLAVIVPVSVSVSPNNVTVSPGDDVKITCSSRGTPRLIVEWYKDDNFMRSQGRTRVSRTSVIISQVQPSDSGYYQCQARHNYGSASDKMYLNVVVEKAPTEPPFKCEDNPYIAHCQVVRQVNYCCIPYYQKACCKTCEDLLPDCNK